MDTHKIHLLQKAFQSLRPDPERAASWFYQRLFELDPSAQELFHINMADQKAKLIEMLNVTLNGLDDLEGLLPTLQRLGERHVDYGATRHHFVHVEAALLWMLEKELGARFTPDVRAAWQEAYHILSTTMLTAYPHD